MMRIENRYEHWFESRNVCKFVSEEWLQTYDKQFAKYVQGKEVQKIERKP